MIPRFTPIVFALIAVLPAGLSAQEASAKEEERLNALSREDLQWREPRNHVTVGLRILGSGGRVDFGNLGERTPDEIAAVGAGAADRTYDNGKVFTDALRDGEKDASGGQTSTPGGRYDVYGTDSNGNPQIVANYLAYTPGQTRNWSATNDLQYEPHDGYLGFSSYTAISEGGGFSNKQKMGGGLELQFSRDFGRLGRRVQWGFVAGITLSSIKSKVAGTVSSTLRTRTDYYQILGSTRPTMPYTTPSASSLFDSEGNLINATGYETTVPLSSTPDSTLSTVTDQAGGAQVRGNWKIKGAYFMAMVGPILRMQLTDSFGLSASAGIAGAYAGTRYTVSESFTVAAMSDLELTVSDLEGSTTTEFLSGYYADLSVDWTINDRTGLFGGVTAQQLGEYSQTIGSRTALVDLGRTVGLRGGVSVRF